MREMEITDSPSNTKSFSPQCFPTGPHPACPTVNLTRIAVSLYSSTYDVSDALQFYRSKILFNPITGLVMVVLA
jgi:hypothetical protein